VNESTDTLKTADGLDLFLRRWWTDGIPHRWTFVIVHGLGEHGGRYQHLAEWFAPRGATVYAMDHRGHGHSGGQRGHAPSLNALLDDIDRVVQRATRESARPMVMIGHSLGGLLAIAYALDHPTQLDRAVFSAPALVPRVKVPVWKQALASVLPKIAPKASFANEIDPNVLSHDPTIARVYTTDPLVHKQITAGLYASTVARGEAFIGRAPDLKVPFLLLHGRDDRIVDPIGSQRFFAAATAPGRAFILYPGLYHEIFNEVEREKVFQDLESWLRQG